MALLELENVAAGYESVDVVSGIDLHVEAREVVTVAGTNGAGKSTIVKAIMGLAPRCSGRISFDGRDLTRVDAEGRIRVGIGYVPQVANVFTSLTTLENLQVVENVPDKVARIEEIFARFPLLRARRRLRAGALSGGERQQLAFARVLMSRPRLMLLDEPTAALAPALVGEVFALIGGLPELGVAAVVVEQRARQALEISARGYILDSGRIVLGGEAQPLLTDERMADLYLGRR